MSVNTCTAPACDRKVVARGLCTMHYQRLMRTGATELVVPVLPMPSSWNAMHKRIRASWGKASRYKCVDCDKGAVEWSYQHDCPEERQDPRGPFCPHIEHYVPRCKDCHAVYDLVAMPRGEDHHRAVLTEELVREARARHAAGATYAQIGRSLGIAEQTIGHAVSGRRWGHVD